jgi:hypothetical protein
MAGPAPYRTVPARHGVAWLVNSFALVRMQLPRLFLIAIVLQFILTLTQLELIGFLFVLAMPGLSAGMLEAMHRVGQGGRPPVFCLFVPLSSGSHVPRLLLLGAIVFLAGATVILLMFGGEDTMVDPDVIQRIEQGDTSALQLIDPGLLLRMMMALAVGVAVSGTLSYFSVPLIWFGNMPLASALKLGVSALLANWKAFAMLALALAAVGFPLIMILGALYGMAGSGLAIIAMLFVMLGFQLVLFATQYCAYLDVFAADTDGNGPGAADGPPPEDDDSQFVA